MTRKRVLPAILALLLVAGTGWGQKVALPPVSDKSFLEQYFHYEYPAPLPYYRPVPHVVLPAQLTSCAGENNADDGDMVSLLVADCLKMWAILWQDGKYAEAATMAGEACRLDPNNGAAEYARALSQFANATRFVHPAAGCPRSCYAEVRSMPGLPNTFVSGLMPAGTFAFDLNVAGTSASEEDRGPSSFGCAVNRGATWTRSAHSHGDNDRKNQTLVNYETAVKCVAAAQKAGCATSSPDCAACDEACEAHAKSGCCCEKGCCSAKGSAKCANECCNKQAACACCTSGCEACAKTSKPQSACACDSKCSQAQKACCCDTKSCCAAKASTGCKCAPVKQSCSCCTNCSCGKSMKVDAGSGCAFLRMLQGLPPGHPHPVIVMNPVPTPVHPPIPAGLAPHALFSPGTADHSVPGMPIYIPPPPTQPVMEGMHSGSQIFPAPVANPDRVFLPVGRPQMPPMVAEMAHGSPAMVPTVIPPPMPTIPLQITATGKRIKVTCPRFEARCDRVSHLPGGDRILLEGKVRVTYRGREAGKVSAERVEVDLYDGAVEVNPPPARPIPPASPVGYYTPVSQTDQSAYAVSRAPTEP